MKTKMQKTIDTLEVAIDKLERLQVQSRDFKQKEERMHLSYIEDMCTESLDPETMEKWQEVKNVLEEIRKLKLTNKDLMSDDWECATSLTKKD